MPKQITLSGKDLDPTGNIIDKQLSLNLDDTNGELGVPISIEVFKKLIGNYLLFNKPSEQEKVMFVINKQLLQILISSEKCKALMVTRCSKEPGVDSIAFVAVDENKNPLGLNADLNPGSTSFSGGEWVGGSTAAELGRFLVVPLQGNPTFDLTNFIKSL